MCVSPELLGEYNFIIEVKFRTHIFDSTVGEAGKYISSILIECKCSTVIQQGIVVPDPLNLGSGVGKTYFWK